MIADVRATFASNTAASGTGVSQILGDVMDLKGPLDNNVLRPAGSGEPIYLVIETVVAAAGGTSVQIQLVTDSAAALNVSRTVHADTGAIAVASLTPPAANGTGGFIRVFPLPPTLDYERFMGLWLTTVGAVTNHTINAFLTHDAARWMALADAVN